MAAISPTNQTYYFDPAKHEIHDTPADDRVRVKLSSPKIMEPSDQEKIIQLAGYLIQTAGISMKLNPHPHPFSNQKDFEIYNTCNKIRIFCVTLSPYFAKKYPDFKSEASHFEIPNKQSCYVLFEKIQANLTKYFDYNVGISEEEKARL